MGDIPSSKLLATEYSEGRSLQEIATKLGHSVHKITYWMRKYNLPRRNRSDAAYIQQNPDGDPFKIKDISSNHDMFLYGLGIGIYWGEGNKANKCAIRVGNTDPELLKVYKRFLLEICQLREEKIGYSIICFNDTDPQSAKDYWASQLNINPNKFGKITQIPPQGKGTYKKKSLYGVCSIDFGNIKLKKWMLSKLSSNILPG
ncbi:hypothetical protein HZB69_00355 [Candidatus Amesbacteria bacterium]|nr:hypothetical protein [Candidatus Amesbacteria bacterium]